MAKLVITENFITLAAQIEYSNKRSEVEKRIRQLADMPGLGSSNLPSSVTDKYGSDVRKLVVFPFDIIYKHNAAEDVVYVLDLIHQRAAR